MVRSLIQDNPSLAKEKKKNVQKVTGFPRQFIKLKMIHFEKEIEFQKSANLRKLDHRGIYF